LEVLNAVAMRYSFSDKAVCPSYGCHKARFQKDHIEDFMTLRIRGLTKYFL
jgi:hypothetical protein